MTLLSLTLRTRRRLRTFGAIASAVAIVALVAGQSAPAYASAKPAPTTSTSATSTSATSTSSAAAKAAPKPAPKITSNAATTKKPVQPTKSQRAAIGKAAIAASDAPNTCSGAISAGIVYPCASIAADGVNSYALTVSQPTDVVYVEVVAADGDQLPLSVTAPDDSAVDCSLLSFPGPLRCTTSVAGTYSLDVQSDGTTTGYTVTYLPLFSTTSCTPISDADLSFTAPAHHGSLAAGAIGDCYTLAQPSGTVVRSLTAQFGITIGVFDATGTQVCFSNGDCALTGTAPYRVLVGQAFANASDYDWQFVRLSDPEGCPTVALQAYGTVPDSTSSVSCRALAVPTAGDYQVGALAPDGGLFFGGVFDATGTQICSVGPSVCTLPAGTVYLIVSTGSPSSTPFGVDFIATDETRGCQPISDTGFASGPTTGSFVGAGEEICLTIPTAAGGAVSMFNGLSEGLDTPNVQVLDATGALLCDNNDFGYETCSLTGTAPFHAVLSGYSSGEYQMLVQRTDSSAGCVTWPQSGFDGSSGLQVSLAASFAAKCLSIPADQHSTGEMIDYSNTANVVNASVTVIDPTGKRICTGASTAVCAYTPGTAYTAMLVGVGGADTYNVVRRDLSQTATCSSPTSTAVAGASTAVTLTSDLDARCIRVAADPGDDLLMGVRSSAAGSAGAILEVADNSGHLICRQFGVPCRVSGSTSYQVIVIASGYAGSPITAHVDTWLVGTSAGWASACQAHSLTMDGFAPFTESLTEAQAGYCAVVTVKPSQALGVYGVSTAPDPGIPWVSMFGAGTWTGGDFCGNLNFNQVLFRCQVPSNVTAGQQALFLIYPYTAPVPVTLTVQGVCVQLCTTPPAQLTVTGLSPASGTPDSVAQVVLSGTGLNMGDTVSLSSEGSTVTSSTPVTAGADGSSLTVELPLTGVTAGTYDVTVTSATFTSVTLPGAYQVTSGVNGDVYVPLTAKGILDTTTGLGAPKAKVGAGGVVKVKVTGVGGVPSTGVTAVVLDLTARDATAATHITAYPDGQPRPNTWNTSLAPGQTVSETVTVPVTDGKVDLRNSSGSVNLIAAVAGYYTNAGTGSSLVTLPAKRILDTRSGLGAPKAKVGAGGVVKLKVAGVGGVPATGVTAVVLNVTAQNATASGHLTAYPDGQAAPAVSNVSFANGQTVSGLVIVPVVNGKVDLRNSSGSVDLTADVTGYFTGDGSAFHAAVPVRLMDTRDGTGVRKGAVGPGATVTLTVVGVGGVPATGVTAVVLNVTATEPTTAGSLTVYPGGQPRPAVASVNFTPNQTMANLVIVPVVNGKIVFRNMTGSVQIVADLDGYFTG